MSKRGVWMFGAFIGDIVGSKYEFNNIKTKQFPLFSEGCDFTDDTIMTAAVAKAMLLRVEEQKMQPGTEKGFLSLLVEVMQDFGRRYPHPTGAYGSGFAIWLRQEHPKPYGSFGNGSAMRVSPCGLAAVTLEEAQALARVSAVISHNHPEGIKGAESVASAVFLAKQGSSKDEIRQYIASHYYDLDFTLDGIRSSYGFDGSCQGSVPQSFEAFLESDSFEDAIRNIISIGGDCDTTGAICGSVAWTFYMVQAGGCEGWLRYHPDEEMASIQKQAASYLPEEFLTLEEAFRAYCRERAEAFRRTGSCVSVLTREEAERFR